jgi:integrase
LIPLLHAAPTHLIPILAIGAFSGIRMTELARLDWIDVNLDRRISGVRKSGHARANPVVRENRQARKTKHPRRW